jgi:hypothetical protein
MSFKTAVAFIFPYSFLEASVVLLAADLIAGVIVRPPGCNRSLPWFVFSMADWAMHSGIPDFRTRASLSAGQAFEQRNGAA